jgi:hypothetical protein
MDSLLGSLTETELSLVREVEPDRLAGLDEDALIELHTRIRRARNKYVKVYRRRAAAEIADAGGRGKAHARNSRNRAKAEVFENLLARVSEQLAAAAHASAKELEGERLTEAAHPVAPAKPVARLSPQRADNRPDSPALRKRHASTRAAGARRQARRDSR